MLSLAFIFDFFLVKLDACLTIQFTLWFLAVGSAQFKIGSITCFRYFCFDTFQLFLFACWRQSWRYLSMNVLCFLWKSTVDGLETISVSIYSCITYVLAGICCNVTRPRFCSASVFLDCSCSFANFWSIPTKILRQSKIYSLSYERFLSYCTWKFIGRINNDNHKKDCHTEETNKQ